MFDYRQAIGAQPVADSTESAAALAALKPNDDRRFTNAELMKYLNWSADDFTYAQNVLGLPKPDAWRQASNLITLGSGEPVRLKRLVDRWADEQRARATETLRLCKGR